MTDELSPRARRLLDLERDALTPDPARRAAIHAATRAALGMPPPGSGGPDGAPPAGSTGAVEGLRAALTTKMGAGLLGAVFLAGAGVGAGSHALLTEQPAPIAAPAEVAMDEPPREPVEVPADEPIVDHHPSAVIEVPRPAPADVPEPTADHHARRPAREVTVEAPRSDLVAERVLLERAETALRRGRPDDARVALEAHAEQFPAGLLAVERDGLRVLAKIASGAADASAEAERYLARHPHGVLSARVRRALESAR